MISIKECDLEGDRGAYETRQRHKGEDRESRRNQRNDAGPARGSRYIAGNEIWTGPNLPNKSQYIPDCTRTMRQHAAIPESSRLRSTPGPCNQVFHRWPTHDPRTLLCVVQLLIEHEINNRTRKRCVLVTYTASSSVLARSIDSDMMTRGLEQNE